MPAQSPRTFIVRNLKWIAAGGICLAGLASCGMPDADRMSVPVSRTAGAVGVKAYFFTAPDGFGFVKGQAEPGVAGVYPRATGEKLAASLSKRRGFELVNHAPLTATAKRGEKREVEVVREFIYPTEYRPPVVGKVVDGEIQSVTPATPTSFEKRDLGVELGYRARPAADGRIALEFDLKRSAFLGFVNYGTPIKTKRKGVFPREVTLSENRIEMPVFDVRQVTRTVLVNDGDFMAVGGMMPAGSPEDLKFEKWKGGSPESCGKNFVALIQVNAVAAE
ncbi:type II and III secretion system protein [Luteolibacter arcticus]|uniref:Type II and III secretion system protein n=1 Tax=Luteolibacter arcticus TaxID=1581411 RepID=A0ABT3GSN5_9BACT|nr:type II and III secretion system protein [Luteolibacter arcticus]MCW1926497.1 type II and III secretion system protein [Luteolibacter arcticus]